MNQYSSSVSSKTNNIYNVAHVVLLVRSLYLLWNSLYSSNPRFVSFSTHSIQAVRFLPLFVSFSVLLPSPHHGRLLCCPGSTGWLQQGAGILPDQVLSVACYCLLSYSLSTFYSTQLVKYDHWVSL